MTLITQIIHYLAVAVCTMLTGLSVAIGQGYTCRASLDALNRQPFAKADIGRATLLALAIAETASLLGFLGSIFIFLHDTKTIYAALAQIGIGLAIAIPGIAVGIAAAFPAQEALISIARQPFLGKKIINLMLLTQSLIQTPVIFGFIIALIIRGNLDNITTLNQALTYIASGLCIGIGSIGPVLGVGYFTRIACKSVGLNRAAYNKLLSFTIISQAIIETPVIFATIIAFWLIRLAASPLEFPAGIVSIACAISMAIGTLGPGISSGRTAAAACIQIAFKPQAYSVLARTSMIGQGLIDTAAIYAFIIALSLILLPLR